MSAKKKAKAKTSKRAAKRSPKPAKVAPKKKAIAKPARAKAATKSKRPAAKAARPKAAAAKAKVAAKPKKATVKKAAAKKAAPKKAAPKKAPARRDGAGHLDPQYAKELLARSRESAPPKDDGRAFLDGPSSGDGLAENLGEDFVEMATSGEDDTQDRAAEEVPEEVGGPFVETSGGTEFASGTDASNPPDAKREPFPTT
jgi:hypothetical protein